MNIQIGDKKKKKISVGLNSRKRQAPKNVFRTESSSSDEDTPVTARQAVNREIVREQQAHAASSAKMKSMISMAPMTSIRSRLIKRKMILQMVLPSVKVATWRI